MADEKMKSGSGMPKNTAAGLSVILGFTLIAPVFFLVTNKDKFVRFHAMQSLLMYLVFYTIQWIFTFTIILIFLIPILWIAVVILTLVLLYKAWQGQEWEVPVLGQYARKFVKKV